MLPQSDYVAFAPADRTQIAPFEDRTVAAEAQRGSQAARKRVNEEFK